MTKSDLRKRYKQLRKTLTFSERERAAHAIAEHLAATLPDGAVVHCFLPIKNLFEVDTFIIIKTLTNLKPDIRWVSSISDFDTLSMPCYALDLNNISHNAYHIPEPAEPLSKIDPKTIDFVITPLLVCDAKGYRIGYGKGFYDRFFTSVSPTCIKIGINFFPPLLETIDINAFDIALNMHASPEGITTFTP